MRLRFLKYYPTEGGRSAEKSTGFNFQQPVLLVVSPGATLLAPPQSIGYYHTIISILAKQAGQVALDKGG